jgi:hypothetical protein
MSSFFRSQSQAPTYSCPSRSISLIHNTQTSLHSSPTLSVCLYSQPYHKPHSTAVPLTPSVCIHNPITNPTPQLSDSLRQSVFTTQSQTSTHKRRTNSSSLFPQPDHKLNHRALPLNPSLNIKSQSQTSPHSIPTYSISHSEHPNHKTHRRAVDSIRRSVFTAQSHTSPHLSHSLCYSVFPA